ncbi:MAG: anthranilate synthase component I family protein [Cyclobacteriaceae bacterium]|nr:anthranilate synthase component I family protein [Cyclobacteriaceae bacterium]
MKPKIYSQIYTQLGDLVTPVSAYLKIREQYPIAALLESSDYQGKENSYSFIAFHPLDSLVIYGNQKNVIKKLESFTSKYDLITESMLAKVFNGAFGYLSFESVRYFDSYSTINPSEIPEIQFTYYKYIIAFDHFNSKLHIIENKLDPAEVSDIEHIKKIINQLNGAQFSFTAQNKQSPISDNEFKNLVTKAKQHCQRGDVFQLVLSRPYTRSFQGDEFNVYRALRSINPSPYLFYFDFGSFKLMGSSPEAQIIVKDSKTEIHPIAGTVRRTGEDVEDEAAAERLKTDPKENAEHAMLVDLARNDLSKSCNNVVVSKEKHLQHFSHVIHLVSIVKGNLRKESSPVKALADSFPAGTLSGAPKFKAVELISTYENQTRGFYGGAIGYFNFKGDLNMAIMIRSLMSKNSTLHYQAGAGIVIDSVEENELQEVENKLGAINQAIELAEQI